MLLGFSTIFHLFGLGDVKLVIGGEGGGGDLPFGAGGSPE